MPPYRQARRLVIAGYFYPDNSLLAFHWLPAAPACMDASRNDIAAAVDISAQGIYIHSRYMLTRDRDV